MRIIRLSMVVSLFLGMLVHSTPQAAALYLDDSNIPGKPFTDLSLGTVYNATDHDDVYRIYLQAGQNIALHLGGPADGPTNDLDLKLFSPAAVNISGTPVASSQAIDSSDEDIYYTAAQDGWYYLDVIAFKGGGQYLLSAHPTWPAPGFPATPERIWGTDRYETAVEIARESFPGWRHVEHVIIASGEDRAAADPLAASGLVWTYGAPILLVRSGSAPQCVIDALKAITAENGTILAHIVGGPNSVSDAVLDQLAAKVSGFTYERIAPNNNRYALAAAISHRMAVERPNEQHGATGGVLIANGEDPEKFFDALALSPITAKTGFPILLVRKDSIPAESWSEIQVRGDQRRIVAGGVNTVSDSVFQTLDAGTPIGWRWSGRDRYETAAVVMRKTWDDYSPDLLWPGTVGVAAKLPDALTGGAFLGLRGGCILVTRPTSVPAPTRDFLHDYTTTIGSCYGLGGTNSITDETLLGVGNALVP